MKTLRPWVGIAVLFTVFSACQSDPFGTMSSALNLEFTTLSNTASPANITNAAASDSLSTFLNRLAPKAETFVYSSTKNTTFRTQRGTKINLSDAVFTDKTGAIIRNNVTLTVQELHTPSDMLLSDKPTNTQKENGYLESYGEFKITAHHIGQPLNLASGSRIVVEAEVANDGKKRVQRMPIWDADTADITQQSRGLNHRAEPTLVTQFFREKRGAMWTQTPQNAEVNAFNRLQFEITTLNQWKNCDIFIDDAAPKTTVMCFFAEHFDPSVYLSGTAFPAAAVYFKPANVNALIKFYQPILNAPLNKSGFYSEENSLPIGTRGTLIAVSFENGKLYVDQRDITVQAPQNGEKAVFFALHPVETDPSVFLSNLRSL